MKGTNKKTVLVVFLIVIALSILTANRYYYGSFSLFSQPVRMVYGGFHYNHRSSGTLSIKDKPEVEISRIIDIVTGKRLFSTTKDFKGPGKTIYLYLGGNNYISYSSGGGG